MSPTWPARPTRVRRVEYRGPLSPPPEGVQEGDSLTTDDGAKYVWRDGERALKPLFW